MIALLLYNPDSGNKTFKDDIDEVISSFQDKGISLLAHRITTLEALEAFLVSQSGVPYEKIIIAGGDGTVNSVVALLFKCGIDVPIGIIPIGATNDFAKHFDLPSAITDVVNMVARSNYVSSDIAYINGGTFINSALIGIKEFQNLSPFHVEAESGGASFAGDVFLILVMNGKSSGGFKRLMTDADIEDGLLDVLIIKKCLLIELGQLLISIGGGKYKENKYVERFRANSLKISSETEVSCRIDGEDSSSGSFFISISDKKLRVITDGLGGSAPEKNEYFSFNEVMQTAGGLIEIIKDMPRHNVIEYVNKNTLDGEYFAAAESALNDGYIYVILSSTGSAAGELIRSVTKKDYSHASLAFDAELKTLISYNGGNSVFAPGMNHELLKFFYKKKDANLLIYKIKATREQKQAVLDEVRKIDREGSSYNLIGLIFPYSHKENIMFCSQFVYRVLKKAGLMYFEKEEYDVKPMDFIELDFRRNLEFESQVYVREILNGVR